MHSMSPTCWDLWKYWMEENSSQPYMFGLQILEERIISHQLVYSESDELKSYGHVRTHSFVKYNTFSVLTVQRIN
jgi:hypothetical protein